MSTAVARANRRRMSPPEAKLWNLLRSEPFVAFHFRRQVPLGRYYADFASHPARLVIEVDGAGHFSDDALARDRQRSAFIESQGYTILRFTTPDVLQRIAGVAESILARLPPPTALRAVPPPHKGEGEVAESAVRA
jgi:very-short-patch-repair endonuclease